MAFGTLAKAELSASTETLVFTAAANQTVNIRFVNRNPNAARIRLAISPTGVEANAYLDYNTPVPGYGILEDTGIAISVGDKIYAWADAANVNVRVFGA